MNDYSFLSGGLVGDTENPSKAAGRGELAWEARKLAWVSKQRALSVCCGPDLCWARRQEQRSRERSRRAWAFQKPAAHTCWPSPHRQFSCTHISLLLGVTQSLNHFAIQTLGWTRAPVRIVRCLVSQAGAQAEAGEYSRAGSALGRAPWELQVDVSGHGAPAPMVTLSMMGMNSGLWTPFLYIYDVRYRCFQGEKRSLEISLHTPELVSFSTALPTGNEYHLPWGLWAQPACWPYFMGHWREGSDLAGGPRNEEQAGGK